MFTLLVAPRVVHGNLLLADIDSFACKRYLLKAEDVVDGVLELTL